MYLDLFRFAISNLFRARGRLFITASGVVIGTTAVILLIGLTLGLQASAEAGVGDNASLTEVLVYPSYESVLTGDGSSTVPLNLETVQIIDNMEIVLTSVPMLILPIDAELRHGGYLNSVTIFGIDAERMQYLDIELVEGELTALQDGQIIVGEDVATTFNAPQAREAWLTVAVDLDDGTTTLSIENYEGRNVARLPVAPVAVIRSSSNASYNEAVFMPLETVAELSNRVTGNDTPLEEMTFEQLIVRSTGRETTLDAVTQIEEMGLITDSLSGFLNEINSFFTIMRVILGGVGFVALLIASFGVANTMMMAIIERTAEIGLMKALGARDADVLAVFLFEAGLVGLVGGLTGAWLAVFLQSRLNNFIAQSATNPQVSTLLNTTELQSDLVLIPIELLGFAVALATMVGFGAGIFPAVRASKMSPMVALKYE